MSRRGKAFWRNENGAAAALYALALPALVAVGGVGFDYARLAGLDSELQNAADQAALAGATQLDSLSGARADAVNAACTLVINQTLLANDEGGRPVTAGDADDSVDGCAGIAQVLFWQDRNKSTAASSDSNARFIEVVLDFRTANYALTPVVGAFFGSIEAAAMAGLGSSICKAPPVMICNPGENSGDSNFAVANYVGKGMKLVSVGSGGGGWAPGNFGYLNIGAGSNGAPGLREALGWESAPGDCIEYTGVDTKPGATVTVTDAINTRFDIYDSNVSCPAGGSCPASINSVKDFQRPANASGPNACKTHNQGWQLPSGYYGETAVSATIPSSTTPSAMGHPRDMCHLATTGACTGPIGDGMWDRNAYFRTNYVRGDGSRWSSSDWQANTGLPSSAKRYDVYKWEIDRRGQTIDGVTILAPRPVVPTGNTLQSRGEPICSPNEGYGSGIVPGGTVADRRRIPIAVVNCVANSVNGNSADVPVLKWVDVFLVEPSFNRALTSAGDVYVEVQAETTVAGGGSAAAQTIRRDVPYLVQ
jgi:Flp pilus assembly protein TadG